MVHGLFLDELNCSDDLGVSVYALSHFTEGALTQHLPDLVVLLEFAVVGLDKVRLSDFETG